MVAWCPAHPAVSNNKKTYPEKEPWISPQERYKGGKKTLFCEIGYVVTVAKVVPPHKGHDPARGGTPPGGMDTDHCDDAHS